MLLRLHRAAIAALHACLATAAMAGHPAKVPVAFSITSDVGFGNEVYVQGDHPDLSSGGAAARGVKLHWSPGNVWSGSIGIEAGAEVSFQYFSLPGSNTGFCSGTATAISSEQTIQVPTADGPPYLGKTVIYTSAWGTAILLYRDLTLDGPWTERVMQRTGDGRTAGESVFQIGGIAEPGSEIEFVVHNGEGDYDNAPGPPMNTAQGAAPAVPVPYQSLSAPYNYRTRLDVLHLQDGHLFNYAPPATVSAPSTVTHFVNSTVAGVPGRNIQVHLPRGYSENSSKRYPVACFHDGQNVFFPGGAFGTWDADRIADYETRMGRMRETIVVAIDNGNGNGNGGDRRTEYIPPSDQLSGSPVGNADDYLQFIRDNVMPTLDHNYRTLNQPGQPARPADTVIAGSSLGGVATSYIGLTGSDLFGKIGIFSPAFWAAPDFLTSALGPATKLPLEIYLDVGTSESSSGESSSNVYWQDCLSVYNDLLEDGYGINRELLFHPDCGGLHNEAAWSRRLPEFYRFALDPWDEPNLLALAAFPPQLELVAVDPAAGTALLEFLAPAGVDFTVWHSDALGSWTDRGTAAASVEPWTLRTIEEDFTPDSSRGFWKLKY